MRTAGLTMNDLWAHRVLRDQGMEYAESRGEPVELAVHVESLDLAHKGEDDNHRPYLRLTGELRSVRPASPLPHGITEVTFSPGHGERVDAFYEFDQEQLVLLVQKGYFDRAFIVPEQVTGIEWELPATADFLVLSPAGTGEPDDVPLVFARVHGTGGMEIDLESCGYDLVEYFPDRPGDSRPVATVDERGLRARSDAINSLFSEDEIGPGTRPTKQQETRPSHGVAADAPTPGDAVTERLRVITAEIENERKEHEARRALPDGSPERLYQERVAQALTDVVKEVPEESSTAGDEATLIDFGPDEEPGPGPVRPESSIPAPPAPLERLRGGRTLTPLEDEKDDQPDLGS